MHKFTSRPREDCTKDEKFMIKNPHIPKMAEDYLYHLALGTATHDLVKMFGDVKYICMGGTSHRMEAFAYYLLGELGLELPTGTTLLDLSAKSQRFCLYKVGPVLSISHGMGVPSLSILLHEVIKLCYHAGVKNPTFFRIGTCGGIDLMPGTVVVSTEALNGQLAPIHQVPMLGKLVDRPTNLDKSLAEEIASLHTAEDDFHLTKGKTMCTDDFYEGQGRLDGAFCEYTLKEKIAFLNKLHEIGVKNIEMEATVFAALTHAAGIRAADICVTLVDRLKGDQVTTPKETLLSWQTRPQKIVARYIKKQLAKN